MKVATVKYLIEFENPKEMIKYVGKSVRTWVKPENGTIVVNGEEIGIWAHAYDHPHITLMLGGHKGLETRSYRGN